MKKSLLAIIALLSMLPFVSNAQWATSGSNIYNSNAGFVGIGTTSPGHLLDVRGPSAFSDGTQGLILGAYTGGSGFGAIYPYTVTPSSSNYCFAATSTGTVLNAATIINFSIANSVMMSLNSTGFGIGTTSPDQLLSVKGIIHSQEVKVDLTGWSDYVLKKEYKLPTLSSVKAYIAKNSRLPEIPSEQEMVKNGLNVGVMNTLLMKKVEELTLYLIEKDKQIEEQKAANKAQNQTLQSQQAQLDLIKQQLSALTKK